MATKDPEAQRYRRLQKIVAPHVKSFNWLLERGLSEIAKASESWHYVYKPGNWRVKVSVAKIKIGEPCDRSLKPVFPTTCRQTSTTYAAPLSVTLKYESFSMVDDTPIDKNFFEVNCGWFPIMLGSKHCQLHGLNMEERIRHHEEENEVGGYFVINGNEKIIRMLVALRRNYPISFTRENYSQSGPDFSPHIVTIRCGAPDQTTKTFTLHYLNSGGCRVRFLMGKSNFFIPVTLLLHALVETSDREIYDKILAGNASDTFFSERAEVLIRDEHPRDKEEALTLLGQSFRAVMSVADTATDYECGVEFLEKVFCVHLDDTRHKFDLIILMIRKLYYRAKGVHPAEEADSPATQEIYLPGQILAIILKTRIDEAMKSLNSAVSDYMLTKNPMPDGPTLPWISKALRKLTHIGAKVEFFLATGNFTTELVPEWGQSTGFVVAAERVNYLRFISLFQCVHRGGFFAQMRTTQVRKLLPSSWGFLCPVHTPDGAICGLINHLAEHCRFAGLSDDRIHDMEAFQEELAGLGMDAPHGPCPGTSLPVIADGRVLGYLPAHLAKSFEHTIRGRKAQALITTKLHKPKYKGQERYDGHIPWSLEISVLQDGIGQFPAIYIHTTPNRWIRPVFNRMFGKREFIGSLEQLFLNISVRPEEVNSFTTHIEEHPTRMLSIVASLTPFCNNNQSPRNMYQCQMLKQSMGTPVHAWAYRADNKMFRLQNPQTPVVKTKTHDRYPIDDYLTGANAVVAVLAYTGYDMEDAMIINKSAYERGFGHGYVYKSKLVDLGEKLQKKRFQSEEAAGEAVIWFTNQKEDGTLAYEDLDEDGLPHVGKLLTFGCNLCSYWDPSTQMITVQRYDSKEDAFVDNVVALGFGENTRSLAGELPTIMKVLIQLKVPRRPTRGDKFSSRHGQKGVLSQLYPQVDMPFSESGMSPDIIINPHAFPSRMTIGMLIESMAGKAGALYGVSHEATAFNFNEKDTAVDYFGAQLAKAGYNYYGNETMYSGITGEEFQVEIFLGIVYYQRLRHMVGDKFQARSKGRRDRITRQPVKGRKKGGGTRFGEMERDSMLAHGSSFLLHDRIMNESDAHRAHLCVTCGSILTPTRVLGGHDTACTVDGEKMICAHCVVDGHKQNIKVIMLPYVTRYLINELAAMNIRTSFEIKEVV